MENLKPDMEKKINLPEESTFEETENDFGLFKAYREGHLDMNILNTQEANADLSSNTKTFNNVIPKSWCLTNSFDRAVNENLTLGSITKCGTSSLNPSEADTKESVVRGPITTEVNNSNQKFQQPGRGNTMLVNQCQRGNAILKHIRNIAWEYADIGPDYVVGRNNCVYFLSLRYHNLNSEYIFERLRKNKIKYQLSVLLVQVDVTDPFYPLKEICKLCLAESLTLILAWRIEEAARYLESYKAFENKPPDTLMAESASSTNHPAQVTEFLTSAKRVTKTDALTIMMKFETITDLIKADEKALEECPGFGQLKARKMHEVFHMKFLRKKDEF